MSGTSNLNQVLINKFHQELLDMGDEIYPHFGKTEQELGVIFERWTAKNVFGLSESDNIFFGQSGDKGIDIGVADDDCDTILLVQCKYSNCEDSIPEFGNNPIDELLNGLRLLNSDNEITNSNLNDLRDDYRRLKDSKIVRKAIVITGRLSADALLNAKQNGIEVYDIDDIIDLIKYKASYNMQPPQELKIRIEKQCIIRRNSSSDEIKLVLAPINVLEIYKILKEHGDSLFLENLRFRLPPNRGSRIGLEIKEEVLKLLENSNSTFDFELETLNNGLNIVCDRILFSKIDGADNINNSYQNLVLVKPQIVNGCQTSWAIHDAVKDYIRSKELKVHEVNSENINVWAKIIPSENLEKKELIAKATNTQNPINQVDIRSADPIHNLIKISLEDYSIPIFYEYKRGLWDSVKNNSYNIAKFKGLVRSYRILNIEQFAQLSIAFQKEPNKARAFKKFLFENDDLYSRAFKLENIQIGNEGEGLSWEESIIFSMAIKSVSEVVKKFYTYKDYKIKENIRNRTSEYRTIEEYKRIRSSFVEYKSAVRYWNYFTIALIRKILDFYKDKYDTTGISIKELYAKVFDFEDTSLVNKIMQKSLTELEADINMDMQESSDDLIDRNNPTNNTKLREIVKWMSSLASLVPKAVKAYAEEVQSDFTNTKNFIEQKDGNLDKVFDYIANEVLRDSYERIRYFPCLD